MPVAVADRCFVVGPAVVQHQADLLGRRLGVDQPRVRPPIGQTLAGKADDVDEGAVHLDHGALVVGDEEPLLQRIHQRVAEFVAICQPIRAIPLFRVAPVAVDESAHGHVEGSQQLQQELQRDRPVDAHVLRDLENQADVVLDDFERADLIL